MAKNTRHRYDGGMEAMERQIIDDRIDELVEAATIDDNPDCPPAAPVISLVARQAIASSHGGKRLRALLAMAAWRAAGGKNANKTRALDIACAIEVFQTAALIHDDIIDDSDMRRGAPAAHKALADALGSPAQGGGLGIMLGDFLATLSVDIVCKAGAPLPQPDEITRAFLDMHRQVETGQVMDIAMETIDISNTAALRDAALATYRWKTASYTTIAPLRLALLAAGVDPREAQKTAWTIGEPLGVAFQINDDLLDVDANPKETGKPVGGDIREGKRTVLLTDTLEHCDADERKTLIRAYSDPNPAARDPAQIIPLMRESGAMDMSRHRITTLWKQTETALNHTRDMFPDNMAFTALIAQCRAFLPLIPDGK